MPHSQNPKTNSSTRHVLEALIIIAQSPRPLGLIEIAERMRLPQSTAHRALMTLEESGFAKRPGRSARLIAGETVHHLIRSMVNLFPARGLLAEQMHDMSLSLDLTVSLNWRVGWHSLRLCSFEGTRESYQIRRVGEARPLHSGVGPTTILAALGPEVIESYLAWWPSSQNAGGAVSDPDRARLAEAARQIAQDGKLFQPPTSYSSLGWLSVPLHSAAGAPVGSLSVGQDIQRFDNPSVLAEIESRCAEISHALVSAGNEAASPFDSFGHNELDMRAMNAQRLDS